MTVPVMNIRKVWVAVRHGNVLVRMAMFAAAPLHLVCMSMVFIVAVFVFMIHFFMGMLMRMALGKVQPYTQ